MRPKVSAENNRHSPLVKYTSSLNRPRALEVSAICQDEIDDCFRLRMGVEIGNDHAPRGRRRQGGGLCAEHTEGVGEGC
jgi:hypothetical protein